MVKRRLRTSSRVNKRAPMPLTSRGSSGKATVSYDAVHPLTSWTTYPVTRTASAPSIFLLSLPIGAQPQTLHPHPHPLPLAPASLLLARIEGHPPKYGEYTGSNTRLYPPPFPIYADRLNRYVLLIMCMIR